MDEIQKHLLCTTGGDEGWLGTIVRQWLSDTIRLRIFNLTMATLLVASLYPVLGLGA
jgi:hypothetical protein